MKLYGQLLTKGDINARDRNKNTALFYAVRNSNFAMVEQLISLGAEHDIACEGNNTVLHEAMKQKNVQIVKFLSHKGANLVQQNSFGEMPLKYADE